MTIDLKHLREVALTAFEVKTVTLLAKSGGEFAWYPRVVKPLVAELVDVMQHKGLAEIIDRGNGLNERFFLRLTDQGRNVASQLDAMSVAPKVEVTASA